MWKEIKMMLIIWITDNLRSSLWIVTSGASKNLRNNPKYYDLLKAVSDSFPVPYSKAIALDVHRTFVNDSDYNTAQNLLILNNVLVNYSRRSISLGYCQGFNLIVAQLIRVLQNELEVFWCFASILEKFLPFNFYLDAQGILIDSTILKLLLKLNNPEIVYHLEKTELDSELNSIFFKWLSTLFTQYVSRSASLCIWDNFFVQGRIVLFKAALGILRILKADILKLTDIDEMLSFIKNKLENFDNNVKLRYYLTEKKFNFDIKVIKNFEKILKKNFMNEPEVKFPEEIASFAKKSGLKSCNIDWPFCIYSNKVRNTEMHQLILKRNLPFNYWDNYFFEEIDPNEVMESRKSRKSLKAYSWNDRNDETDRSLGKNLGQRDRRENIFKDILNERNYNSFLIERVSHTDYCLEQYKLRGNISFEENDKERTQSLVSEKSEKSKQYKEKVNSMYRKSIKKGFLKL